MQIPNTAKLLAKCWVETENSIRELSKELHSDKDEEFITELFHDCLRSRAKSLTQMGRFEKAFFQDLQASFPNLYSAPGLQVYAKGISATVTRHPKHIEAKSGGDLGLVIVRPRVTQTMMSILSRGESHKQGLLCQAKVRRRPRRSSAAYWGTLSVSQKKVLADRLNYTALLLYKYADEARRELRPFRWQLCGGAGITEVESWLASDSFPAPQPSDQVIRDLAKGIIGTDDPEAIANHICPEVRETLEIVIGWPDGSQPPDNYEVVSATSEQEQVRVRRM